MAKKNEKKQETPTEDREAELIADVQRLQAEFENFKKRTAQEQETFKQRAGERVIAELLPLVDNFELALKNNTEESDFSKGVELIFAQLKEVLSTHGVEAIEADGKPFDPAQHEALMTKKDDAQENNVVLEVMQAGYTMHGKVLRPAKVIVNKK